MRTQPRGIRLNNPGNIEHGDRWLGMAADQPDPRFIAFAEPVYGLRALARLLLNYQRKHGIRTVSGLISRYAPPFENDAKAYASAVARACGVSPDDPIDVDARLADIIPAVVRHENGIQPYDEALIRLAADMARAG
jgi:hypothetical protein